MQHLLTISIHIQTSTSQGDEDKPIEPEAAAQLDSKPDMESEIDIDLTDPEVEKAATKIQAGFKGFKTRKEAKIAKVYTPSA